MATKIRHFFNYSIFVADKRQRKKRKMKKKAERLFLIFFFFLFNIYVVSDKVIGKEIGKEGYHLHTK
jgi:hypothetical protein